MAPYPGLRRLSGRGPRSQEEALDRGTVVVVREQVANGVDIPTDGEIRREHDIHYQCRNFTGFDFAGRTRKSMRQGSWSAEVPTVRGLIRSEALSSSVTGASLKVLPTGPRRRRCRAR